MILPDFLTRDSTGEIRLTGHRIGLYHLVRYYDDGYSVEMLACQFPGLQLAMIHKAIAYYLENKNGVDAYIASCREELDRQRTAKPEGLPLKTLRERLIGMQHAKGA